MTAAPNPAALLIYIFCAISGIVVERRFLLNSLVKRILLIYSVAAAQIMISVELLSIAKALTGWSLIFLNCGLTAIVLMGLRRLGVEGRSGWRELVARACTDLRVARKDWPTGALFVVAAGFFVMVAAVGWMMLPYNDSYHFEMPRFWLQNESAYPFPCHNPRITTITFLSEAMELPGFVSFRNDAAVLAATIIAAMLVMATLYSLARRLGASVIAAAAAATVSVGYMTFASSIYTAAAEMLLSGAFFGGSVIFLMDVWANDDERPATIGELGCSIFLFVMACGAKNPTTVVAPFYLICLAIASWRMLTRQFGKVDRIAGKMAFTFVAAGLIGLLCSGVAWNYGANKIYFGANGMPRLMKSVVSHNYRPQEVWTRLARGGVLVAYDTLWMPKSLRETYKSVAAKTVRLLGGEESLPEDDPYYSFEADPMKGFGPLGIILLIPGLIVGVALSIRALRKSPTSIGTPALNVLTLTTLAIAAFVMVHLVLRWQSIGMVRLMFPILVAAAPLTALLLERRWLRVMAVGLLAMVGAILFVYTSGLVSRRVGRTDGIFFKAIAKLQNDRATTLTYQWKNQGARKFVRREHYTYREIYDTVLAGLRQPCTIGFIGDENSECLYLFGKRAQNRIIPMVDAVNEHQVMNVSGDQFDYVVAATDFEQAQNWARGYGFAQIFTCTGPKGEIAIAFEKIRAQN